jgi:hypothetical protein
MANVSNEPLPPEGDEQRLAKIERENAVLRLDLEWQQTRQGFLDEGGNEPSAAFPFFVLLLGLILSALCFYLGATNGKEWGVLLGIVFLVAAIGGARYTYVKYSDFRQRKNAYQQRRAELTENGSEESSVRDLRS